MTDISIIVATYNREGLLSDAIASIALQAGINLGAVQVIVVNDGGTPITGVVELARRSGLRVDVVSHPTNRGLASARNSGLERVEGNCLCFLDDDDTMLPDHLSTLIEPLQAGTADIVTSTCLVTEQRWVPSSKGASAGRWNFGLLPEILPVTNTLPIHSAMLRSSLAVPFDESLSMLEDWKFWLDVTSGCDGMTIAHIDQPTVLYHRAPMGTLLSAAAAEPADMANLINCYVAVWTQLAPPTDSIIAGRGAMMSMYSQAIACLALGQQLNPHYYQECLARLVEGWGDHDPELYADIVAAVTQQEDNNL